MTLQELRDEASFLIGREVEIETLQSGKKIVLWMSFSAPPPPPGDTEEEALKNFIQHFRVNTIADLPDVNVPSQTT